MGTNRTPRRSKYPGQPAGYLGTRRPVNHPMWFTSSIAKTPGRIEGLVLGNLPGAGHPM